MILRMPQDTWAKSGRIGRFHFFVRIDAELQKFSVDILTDFDRVKMCLKNSH